MTSQTRIDANRKNAQKSTGPRSSKGKSRASRNATKHGLLARTQTLIGENPAAYELLVIEMIEQYGAETQSEVMLAQNIADDLFWLNRCKRLKIQLIRYRRVERDTAGHMRILDEIGGVRPSADDGINSEESSQSSTQATSEWGFEDQKKHIIGETKKKFRENFVYITESADQLADDVLEVMDELEKLDRYETTRLKSLEKKERLLSSMIARRRDHEKG